MELRSAFDQIAALGASLRKRGEIDHVKRAVGHNQDALGTGNVAVDGVPYEFAQLLGGNAIGRFVALHRHTGRGRFGGEFSPDLVHRDADLLPAAQCNQRGTGLA